MVDIPSSCNRLFLVLGDQLDYERFLPADFDPQYRSFLDGRSK